MKDPMFYKIIRPLLKVFMKVVFHPTYIGLENIPKKGPYILSGNHTNNFDSVLLVTCTKDVIHFLAKDSLLKGWKKIIFKNMAIIPVDRSIHDKGALNNAIEALKEHKVIGIFPEGTINRTKDIVMPFKIGAVKMAHDTNSSIVPFIITGKYKPFKNDLTIEFLKPYKIKSDNLTKENEKLMQIISKKLEEKRK